MSSFIRFSILIALPNLAFTVPRHRAREVRSNGNSGRKGAAMRGWFGRQERAHSVDRRGAYVREARRLVRKNHLSEYRKWSEITDPDVLYRATHSEECRKFHREEKKNKTKILVTKQRIPSQLVLTGRNASLDDVHPAALANIRNVSKMSPSLSIRWLSDQACLEYLSKHFDDELVQIYRHEVHGAFRGDICRTAVLLREGGFYMDLDVELVVPLTALVDNATTFMAVYEAPEMNHGGMLNALMAVEPANAVMNATLGEIRRWYQQPANNTGWMGPVTLLAGLNKVVRDTCPCESVNLRKKVLHWQNVEPQWQCGSHFFRFNVQRHLFCTSPHRKNECPEPRRTSRSYAVRQGFFFPGREREIIGWPRPAWCTTSGCGYGGLDDHNISGETPV